MSQFDFDRVSSADQPQNNMEGMIDIETFGTTAGTPVITIGAVLFDLYSSDSSEELVRRSIGIRIDISDAVKYATHVDGSTMRWWFEQEDAAIKALVGDNAVSAQEALKLLEQYLLERGKFVNSLFFDGLSAFPKACRFWAKDPDFDMRLLQHYYDQPDLQGAKQPWKFWECRSVRTVQDLAWPGGKHDLPAFEIPGVAHDARWDAIHQAMTIQAAMRRLGLAKDQDVQFKAWEGVQK